MSSYYAVFRSGVRASETVYTDPNPTGQAKEEYELWKRVADREKNGEIIEIKEVKIR